MGQMSQHHPQWQKQHWQQSLSQEVEQQPQMSCKTDAVEQTMRKTHQQSNADLVSWWESSGSSNSRGSWDLQKNASWSKDSWQTASWLAASNGDRQTLGDLKDRSKVDDSCSSSIWGEPRGSSAWSTAGSVLGE